MMAMNLQNLKRRREEPSIPDRARGITMPYFIRYLASHSVLQRGNRVILYIDKSTHSSPRFLSKPCFCLLGGRRRTD
jgi:hypothetical protein